MIHTNKKHPFLTVEKGFLPVGQITLGMHVVEADGQVGVISGWKVVPGVMTMYNLEVAQDHTFTVGAGEWVVHNCGGSGVPSNSVGATTPTSSPDFIVTSQGETIVVPKDAIGPTPAANGRGFQYTGGSGGHGLDPRVSGVRIMDPTPPRGPSPGYPGGYVSYFNRSGQAVNPFTGQTIPPANPMWHIPLRP